MYPSASTLKTRIVNLTLNCVILISKEIDRKKLLLMCDECKDYRRVTSVVKLFACLNKIIEKSGSQKCFGLKSVGNTLLDAAKAIDHALKLLNMLYNERSNMLKYDRCWRQRCG